MGKLLSDWYSAFQLRLGKAIGKCPVKEGDTPGQTGPQPLLQWIEGPVREVMQAIQGGLLRDVVFPAKTGAHFHTAYFESGPPDLSLRPMLTAPPPPGVSEYRGALNAVWLLTAPIQEPLGKELQAQYEEVTGRWRDRIHKHPEPVALLLRSALGWVKSELPGWASSLQQAESRRPDAQTQRELAEIKAILQDAASQEPLPAAQGPKPAPESRCPPLSKTEIAKRLLDRESAKPRDAKQMMKRQKLRREGDGKWTILIDDRLSKEQQGRLRKPLG